MTMELDDPWFQRTEDEDAHPAGPPAASLAATAFAIFSISGVLALAGVAAVTVLFSP